jgi:hypothetical protein
VLQQPCQQRAAPVLQLTLRHHARGRVRQHCLRAGADFNARGGRRAVALRAFPYKGFSDVYENTSGKGGKC